MQSAEQQRNSSVQAALLVMTHAMNDIAHLSPGEVERLVEQQALDLNLSMLENRSDLAVQYTPADTRIFAGYTDSSISLTVFSALHAA